MSKINQIKNFSKGFIKENPVFVLFLGLCPTLGVTTSAINGMGMGLATTFVLVMSNLVVSLIKSFIPDNKKKTKKQTNSYASPGGRNVCIRARISTPLGLASLYSV